MPKVRWVSGLALMLLLLARPRAAAAGALQSAALWYASVAPALFPFMALMPLLTGEDAARAYEKLLGGAMRKLFRLPGGAAPAFVVGMLAGSPAGTIAARRAAAQSGMNRGQLLRLAAAASGLSPAFLVGGIGEGLLGSAEQGRVLLRSQMTAQIVLALLLRRAWEDRHRPVEADPGRAADQPVLSAVLGVLNVCGYMAMFGALTQVVGQLVGPSVGKVMLCLLDLPAGAKIVSGLSVRGDLRLVLVSAMCGFGGACIGAQNLAALAGCGVRPAEFFAVRLAAAALNAALTAVQLGLRWEPGGGLFPRALPAAVLCAAALAIPAILRLRKSIS